MTVGGGPPGVDVGEAGVLRHRPGLDGGDDSGGEAGDEDGVSGVAVPAEGLPVGAGESEATGGLHEAGFPGVPICFGLFIRGSSIR
jgi:hypothetical protein